MASPTEHSKNDILNSALRLVGSPPLAADDESSVSYTAAIGALKDAQFAIFGTNIFQYNTRRVFLTGREATDLDTEAYPPPGGTNALGREHEYKSPAPAVFPYLFDLPKDFNLIIGLTTKDGMHDIPFTFSGHSMTANYTDSSGVDTYVATTSSLPRLYSDHIECQLTYSFVPNLIAAVRATYISHDSVTEGVHRIPDFLYNVVALYIAQAICLQLTGDTQRAVTLYEKYQKALSRARIVEGRSSPHQNYIDETSSRLLDSHNRYGKV